MRADTKDSVPAEKALSAAGVRPAGSAVLAGLAGHRGGNGLAGMRERVERLGGTMDAGPVEGGWLVVLSVPNTRGRT
jgi:glucose-6-phosphate-specific signal transduction histidine kinase